MLVDELYAVETQKARRQRTIRMLNADLKMTITKAHYGLKRNRNGLL